MFKRLMVANRGEVAVRIARTCRRLGIETVVAYSEADREAPWLEEFDDAICIGPAAPSRSYLDQEALLQAAVQHHVQALHPGWGFLAENALFAARVRQLHIAWVGPPPRTIRLMGDKALARSTLAELGLASIPGSNGRLLDADQALELAAKIGYPVLLKATAGGGGRGIRRCDEADQLRAAFAEASGEAASAFGDGGLYLEKFLERGRHIEFQIVADGWGHAIHLFERECSVQRRHQKLIEEAPSPAIDPTTRRDYGERAAHAAQKLAYEGAGTMEFLLSPDGQLYFMEMNTRLQVEHPVTELITGHDLVELQLRVAAGERLDINQQDVELNGHAIEARINAEDTTRGFKPVPGRIGRFEFRAHGGPGTIRVDTHVRPPYDVPPFYDSMIAKVIAHGENRELARQNLIRTLVEARVDGVPTTIPAHLALLDHPRFVTGDYDTELVDSLLTTENH